MKITKITRLAKKMLKLKYCGAVIVAAGSSSRMGSIDKIMEKLDDDPVIVHSVRAFQNCDAIREIVVVTRPDRIVQVADLCAGFSKVSAVVAGGSDRPDSVRAGLAALSKKVKLVAVHDGARPLVTEAVIDRTVRACNTYGAALPAVPVKDTVKQIHGGIVASTPPRSSMKACQTPQVFDLALLRAALQKAKQAGNVITDDSSAVENMGMSVKVVAGDERNIKITTPTDMKIARMLLEEMQCE